MCNLFILSIALLRFTVDVRNSVHNLSILEKFQKFISIFDRPYHAGLLLLCFGLIFSQYLKFTNCSTIERFVVFMSSDRHPICDYKILAIDLLNTSSQSSLIFSLFEHRLEIYTLTCICSVFIKIE